MLAGNEEKLVRRVVSFHTGDAFERDIVSISGVTTCIERIPAPVRTSGALCKPQFRGARLFGPHSGRGRAQHIRKHA